MATIQVCGLLNMRKIATWFALLLVGMALRSMSAGAASMYWQMLPEQIAEIFIEGPIVRGDGEQFRTLALSLIDKGHVIKNVHIFSQGGMVLEAVSIGQQIRALKLNTTGPVRLTASGYPKAVSCGRAAYDHFGKQRPPSQFENWTLNAPWPDSRFSRNDQRCTCASACFLIWASGTERFGDWIGLHRPSFVGGDYGTLTPSQAQQKYEAMIVEVKSYLSEMGVPESIVRKMMAANSKEISLLTTEEAEQLYSEPYLDELMISRCGGDIKTLNLEAAKVVNRNKARFQVLEKEIQRIALCRNDVQRELFRENVRAYLDRFGR